MNPPLPLALFDVHYEYREALAYSLEETGRYDVVVSTSRITDLIRELNAAHVAVIVVDFSLARADTLRLIKRLRKIFPQTRIVFTSCIDVRGLPKEALQAGADLAIKKIMDFEDYNRVIEDLMSLQRAKTSRKDGAGSSWLRSTGTGQG